MDAVSATETRPDVAVPFASALSGASWGAIVAGAVAIVAMTLVMLALGVGFGLSVVSPWGGAGISPTTFKIGTGLYFIVISMIASGVGGHITGRLRRRYIGIHDNETYFRDTANGFLAWALATIVGVAVLASAASGLASISTPGVAGSNNGAQNGPVAIYVDRLLRPEPNVPPSTTGNDQSTRGELNRLLTSGLRSGNDLKSDDRAYLALAVSRQTGLSQADAQKRVDDVLGQARSDLDAARKAALQLALWLTASMLLGAFAAAIAATEGGAFRDRNWGVRATV